MIRRPPRSTQSRSSAASDVYKRQGYYDAYYLKAQKVRTLIKRDFDLAFEGVDAILTPTTPGPAFGLGEKSGDPLEMYLNDIFTVTVHMAGLPGMSIPAGP